MTKLFYISLGGVFGVLARYALSGTVHRFTAAIFPLGTMFVNLTGCFLIGVMWALSEYAILPAYFKPFVFVGFLGGYTTFSTFALESLNLFKDGEYKAALLNVLLSNIGGIILVFAGFMLVQYLLKK